MLSKAQKFAHVTGEQLLYIKNIKVGDQWTTDFINSQLSMTIYPNLKKRNVYNHDASFSCCFVCQSCKNGFFDKPLFDGNSVDIHMLTKMHNQNPRLKLGGHQILM